MVVELLYVEGCSNVAGYLPRLQQLVAAVGLDEPIRTHVIADDEEVQRERFLGSPTIRIDGADVDPSVEGRLDYGLTGRLYATVEGPQHHPADAWVLDRLRQQGSER